MSNITGNEPANMNGHEMNNEDILALYKTFIGSHDEIWITKGKRGEIIGKWHNDNGYEIIARGEDILFNDDGTPSEWLKSKLIELNKS